MCMPSRSWTIDELREELNRYEAELRSAGKARNTVTTYVQHPERFLNWLVGRYRPSGPSMSPPSAPPVQPAPPESGAGRSRYQPLKDHC